MRTVGPLYRTAFDSKTNFPPAVSVSITYFYQMSNQPFPRALPVDLWEKGASHPFLKDVFSLLQERIAALDIESNDLCVSGREYGTYHLLFATYPCIFLTKSTNMHPASPAIK